MELFLIFIGAMLVNNFVLSQFLGICSFIGVSKKKDAAVGMGLAVKIGRASCRKSVKISVDLGGRRIIKKKK